MTQTMSSHFHCQVSRSWRCPKCGHLSPLPLSPENPACARCGEPVLAEAVRNLEADLRTALLRALFEKGEGQVATGHRGEGWRLVTKYRPATGVVLAPPATPRATPEPSSEGVVVKCSHCGAALSWRPSSWARDIRCSFCHVTNVIPEQVWLEATARLPELWVHVSADRATLVAEGASVALGRRDAGATFFRALQVLAEPHDDATLALLAAQAVEQNSMGGLDIPQVEALPAVAQVALVNALRAVAARHDQRVPFGHSNLQGALLQAHLVPDAAAVMPLGSEREDMQLESLLLAFENTSYPLRVTSPWLSALSATDDEGKVLPAVSRAAKRADSLLSRRVAEADVSSEDLVFISRCSFAPGARSEARAHARFPVAASPPPPPPKKGFWKKLLG